MLLPGRARRATATAPPAGGVSSPGLSVL
jgi:hypothetical protein